MPTCRDCGKDVPKAGFAKSQLKKPTDKRRCKGCALRLAGGDVECDDTSQSHACWICLCTDADDHGRPRRDCSCRGTAGYVHVSCLVDMAAKKSETIDINPTSNPGLRLGVSVGGNTLDPWRECMTCRQCYSGRTMVELAKAMESRYDREAQPVFWRNATYDFLSGVLLRSGDYDGALRAIDKRMALCRDQYRTEVLAGRDRADISCCRDLVNGLTNKASVLITRRIGSQEDVAAILSEAGRYAEQIQKNDGGRSCGFVWRQRAFLEQSIGNHEQALKLMQKTVKTLGAIPGYKSSLNGIKDQWVLSEMMIATGELIEAYDLMKETIDTAERVLGADHPFVASKRSEWDDYVERIGDTVDAGRAFRKAGIANDGKTFEGMFIATGFCYTGQKVKIVGVARDERGYVALVGEDGGKWESTFVPFPAVCVDSGTRVVLVDLKSSLNGKRGLVEGHMFENNETSNFDALRLLVKVDGIKDEMRVKPKNAMVEE